MSKKLAASYNVYLNSRLKEICFHGIKTHPLYVRVSYLGKPIYFKASSFDHFSNPSKVIRVAGMEKPPSMKDVIQREMDVLKFIISDKLGEDFTWGSFETLYNHYSKEMTDLTEHGFIDYVYTFFNDQGMPALAKSLELGMKFTNPWNVVQDLKQGLTKSLYELFIENSIHMAPPYLALAGYAANQIKWPEAFSIMKFEDSKMRSGFDKYVKKTYPEHFVKILNQVYKLIEMPIKK